MTELSGGWAARQAECQTVLCHPTAGLLLADMFGVGCIGLPGVFQRLGWLVRAACCRGASCGCASCRRLRLKSDAFDTHPPSLRLQVSFVLLVTFSLGCGYLGVLFSKLAVALPNATTMDDIGGAALGQNQCAPLNADSVGVNCPVTNRKPTAVFLPICLQEKPGRRLVWAVVYTTILVDPIALHITCMFAIQQVRHGGEVGGCAGAGLLYLADADDSHCMLSLPTGLHRAQHEHCLFNHRLHHAALGSDPGVCVV